MTTLSHKNSKILPIFCLSLLLVCVNSKPQEDGLIAFGQQLELSHSKRPSRQPDWLSTHSLRPACCCGHSRPAEHLKGLKCRLDPS
jgi:hypothetical protein